MNLRLGFHYHTGTLVDGGGIAAPAHLAMFVEELARQAGPVTYLAHSGTPAPTDDSVLSPTLVRAVDLGERRSAPTRMWLQRPSLRDLDIDVLLVRAPTPLAPYLVRSDERTAVLLVGDYSEWRPSAVNPWWRNLMIRAFVRAYARQQRRAFRGRLVLANNAELALQASGWGARAEEVFTSSLSRDDVGSLAVPRSWEASKGHSEPVRLLFTGRVSEEKGIGEAIVAVADLADRGYDVHLDIVGGADDKRFLSALETQAQVAAVADRIVFHGYKRAGSELLQMYLGADVFVLPSRADAFPRSLTEALAAGLPAVATRVGGIPDRMTHERTALLVDPGSPRAIADAVERIVLDAELRARLADEGRRWASSFTNERSCELILTHLRSMAASPA